MCEFTHMYGKVTHELVLSLVLVCPQKCQKPVIFIFSTFPRKGVWTELAQNVEHQEGPERIKELGGT